MKTLLCVIALVGLVALPILAEEVKVDITGSRLAAGYIDAGSNGNNTAGSFSVPDAKLRTNVKVNEDTSAVIRLSLNNGIVGGTDYLYVKLDNVVNKLTGGKGPINPEITVGRFKINFGEETWNNNPVEGALVTNSVANATGYDEGIQFKQNIDVPLPFILGASLALMNGNAASGDDNNNGKAHAIKVTGQMKNAIGPGGLYFSLSNYGSGKLPCLALVDDAALSINGMTNGTLNTWTRKVVQLDVRFDLLEGAQKFDPSKAPLFSDAKGVFRFAYGQGTDGEPAIGKINVVYVMLDGIYNIDNKMYVAFRYSYADYTVDRFSAQDGTFGRTSIGGGYKVSDISILKLEYTLNSEPDTATNPELENDQISLLLTTKW